MSTVYSARQIQRTREMFTQLSAAMRGARFYPVAHPAVQVAHRRPAEDARPVLRRGLGRRAHVQRGRDPARRVRAHGGERAVRPARPRHEPDRRRQPHACAGACERTSSATLVGLLVTDPEVAAEHGGIVEMARAAGLPHAQFAAVTVLLEGREDDVLRRARPRGRPPARRTTRHSRRCGSSSSHSAGNPRARPRRPGCAAVVQALIDNVLGNRPRDPGAVRAQGLRRVHLLPLGERRDPVARPGLRPSPRTGAS